MSASSSLNLLSRGSFISPAFIRFLFAFNQLSISCSSMRWRDGLRWLVSMKEITSLYLVSQRSSCVIALLQHSTPAIPVLVLISLSFGEITGNNHSSQKLYFTPILRDFPIFQHLIYGENQDIYGEFTNQCFRECLRHNT